MHTVVLLAHASESGRAIGLRGSPGVARRQRWRRLRVAWAEAALSSIWPPRPPISSKWSCGSSAANLGRPDSPCRKSFATFSGSARPRKQCPCAEAPSGLNSLTRDSGRHGETFSIPIWRNVEPARSLDAGVEVLKQGQQPGDCLRPDPSQGTGGIYGDVSVPVPKRFRQGRNCDLGRRADRVPSQVACLAGIVDRGQGQDARLANRGIAIPQPQNKRGHGGLGLPQDLCGACPLAGIGVLEHIDDTWHRLPQGLCGDAA